MAQNGLVEFKFELGDRGGLAELSGLQADARRIQSILFSKGRVDAVGMDLHIEDIQFELATDESISSLKNKITEQIATFCPGVIVRGLLVEYLPASMDPSGRGNAVLIGISIGSSAAESYDFGFLQKTDSTGTVVSIL